MFHPELTGKMNLGTAFSQSRSIAVGLRQLERADNNRTIQYLERAADAAVNDEKARKMFRAQASALRAAIGGMVNPGETRGYVRPTGAQGLPKSAVKKHRRPSKRTKADKAALANAEAKRARRAAR